MTKKNALVVIDVQREYVTEGRPFYLQGIEPSLNNIQKVLAKARQDGWEIIHVRHLQEGNIFAKDTEFAAFVPGFEPLTEEQEIHKGNFSCFSSPEFEQRLSELKDYRIHIVGYGSTMCCLSTIIEGYHKGYEMVFIHDASRAKRTDKFDEESHHAHATEYLATFSKVIATDQVVNEGASVK
ncbi:cysteine hydrolase family protein [Marininema halotolerans]|uniref:Nicotinamidase-related amidase n=1 Tax=Marininema halotolerans TaxID=1155944 RepID=A0A1I6NRQ8_9BACL|nr:isochorismatase family cysteine hydrolase [Marininema halotolerans]SFS30676.1 Nicotinamidase-related amidase [Marininema halotolerans]